MVLFAVTLAFFGDFLIFIYKIALNAFKIFFA